MPRLRAGLVVAGRYRLIRHLASGGMGEVWQAVDQRLRRRVAVKTLHPRTAPQTSARGSLRAEAAHLAQVSHPNVLTVHDFGEDRGREFLVLELVEGPTLAEVVAREGPLDAECVRVVLLQLAGALEAAHTAGIVHRDVKPANVILHADGTVRLSDFGIAGRVGSELVAEVGEVLGTTHYLSPEQALGDAVTASSDLYSLGVLAHELLSGRKPFDKGSPIATALAHVTEVPPDLPAGTPDELATIVASCLAKDPRDRPASAGTIRGALSTPFGSARVGR
ncbi:MAG TPA: serine/threonine-protein kinase [Propionicimonas sp.]